MDDAAVLRPGGENELYDLGRDPREMHNVFRDSAYRGRQDELRTRMLEWYIRTSDAVPFGRDDRSLPPRRSR